MRSPLAFALRSACLGVVSFLLAAGLAAQGAYVASTGLFVPNHGQWKGGTLYQSVLGRGQVGVDRGGITIGLRDHAARTGHAIRVSLGSEVEVRGAARAEASFHFLIGEQPGSWKRFIPGFEVLELVPDAGQAAVTLAPTRQGLQWNVEAKALSGVVAPRFVVDGGLGFEALDDGGVVFHTSAGDVTWTAPRWRAVGDDTTRQRVGRWAFNAGRLELDGSSCCGTDLPLASASWSTFFGGDAPEFFSDVTAHDDGSITAGGYTLSTSVPTTPGAFQVEQFTDGEETGIVARFSADGSTLQYATFLGGLEPGTDYVRAVHATQNGAVLVAGQAGSRIGFPVTEGAYDTEHDELSTDGFIGRLSSDGSELEFCTLLGGDLPFPLGSGGGNDVVTALDVDSAGNILVAGTTNSPLFPVTPGAFQPAMSLPVSAGNQEGFVAKLSADGSALLHATYLGGGIAEGSTDVDWLRALAVLPDDSVVVVGSTTSVAFPTTPDAFAPADFAKLDGFVTRLSPDLTSLVFSSYLGGDGEDKPHDVAIHPDGSILVAGEVTSLGSFSLEFDFPITSDAADPIPGGTSDAFLTQIDPSGERILYSTFVGGSGREQLPVALAVDSAGGVTLACTTFSFDAPVTPGALLTSKPSGENDHTGMVARYHPTNRSLLHGTYLGGSAWDIGIGGYTLGLLVTPQGDAVLAQGALSEDFPLTELGAIPEYAGLLDGFVSSLTMLPTGVTRFGASTPIGEHALAVGVLAMPAVGADGFGVSCTGAPPATDGYLLLSSAPLATPQSALGTSLWVDPSRLLGLARVRSNALGYSQTRLPIPDVPALVGVEAYAQYLWPSPAPAEASAALAISVQP